MSKYLEYDKLVAKVWFSTEDDLMVGKFVGIPDSVTFHGKTVHELKQSFQAAAKEYISFCKRVGKKAQSYTGSFNVRIQPELHQMASRLAENQNASLNTVVKEALSEKVDREFNQTMV